MTRIAIKRAYDPPAPGDGTRVLVDRLWPRGLAKANAKIDHWLKDIAPSNDLRRWFGHDPARWDGFRERYAAELSADPERLRPLRELMREGPLTLLFSARDDAHNNAVALREILLRNDRA